MIAGGRVLIAEDEAIVADMLETMLLDQGLTVVGPAGSVGAALSLVASEEIDAAILDVNLRGESIEPVANALRTLGIPMIFATGYGHGIMALAQGAPILTKPYTAGLVSAALKRCFERQSGW